MSKTPVPPVPDDRSAGEVRSLVRGLDVLVAVNESPPATVSRLVEQTGLPKATVVRLLNTLRSQGYVMQDPGGLGYRPSPRVRRLASAMMVESPFLTEVRRRLIAFGQLTKWPSDLLLAEQGAMLIVVTNRDVAPIRLERIEQRRFPLLDSAAGLAYLGALQPVDCELALSAALEAERSRGDLTTSAETVRRKVGTVRRRGYSVRDYGAPIEGTRVIGVGIGSGRSTIGGLSLILLRDAVTAEQIDGRLVPAMRDEAAAIADLFARLSGPRGAEAVLPSLAQPLPTAATSIDR